MDVLLRVCGMQQLSSHEEICNCKREIIIGYLIFGMSKYLQFVAFVEC